MKASFRKNGFLTISFITVVAKSPPTASPSFDRILAQVKKDAANATVRAKYTEHIMDEDIKERFFESWGNAVYGVIDGGHR
jgi:hypothetical protein